MRHMAWASFWYQYLVGGAIFLVGMVFCVRQGFVGLQDRAGRRNLFVLVGGLVLMFGLHLGLMLAGSAGS